MVAVKTGLTTPPPMPGMPAPMQPMMPMGGPGTFPAAPLPAGQTPVPPSMPPLPLAGMPPPPMRPPMAQPPMPQQQQGSNAPRRKRFGDSLEGMLGRNMFAPQQQRPLPMPPQMMPQQRMVAPGTPMMRTPTPRPMNQGGIVQYMNEGGVAKPSIAEFMDATGVTAAQASQALYGSVGSNQDIRDWDAIMSSSNPLEATQAATAQMYGSGSAIATDDRFYDEQGNYDPDAVSYGGVPVGASTSGPKLEITSNGQVYITSSDGLPLTQLSAANAASFGVTQDQINAAIEQGGNISGDVSSAGFNPSQTYGNLLTGVSNTNTGSTGSSGSSSSTGSSGSTSSSGSTGSVESSGLNQTGNVASFSGGLGQAALFGPVVTDTPSYSQFVQNPVTNQITATAGPTMTAVSPIGSIDLPAAPVEIDIYDYLADPVFGSLSPIEKNMGGVVPMQTNIAGQPHGLAYINQDEEALLRSFGGSGIAGPGGIPSYPPTGVTSGGGSGASTSFDSGYKPITTNYTGGNSAFDDDDEDYTPTSDQLNQQLSDQGLTNLTSDTSNVNYDTTGSGDEYETAAQADTDVSGFEYVALGGLGTGDSGTPTNIAPISLGSDDPVVFTDIMGRTYSNAADRDRANLGYQQASYGQGNYPVRLTSQKFREFGDFGSDEEGNRAAREAYFADPNYVPPSVYNLQNTPDIFSNMFNQPILPPKIGDDEDKDDKDDSDDGTSNVNKLLALESEFAPAEGGYSLVDLKKRISLAEGTSDKDGYKRLLGGQETNRFKIDPTKMTVQEILDFQNKRGEGSYAEYSKGVNKNLGKLNDAGTEGVISTPVGKYQIVGSTLQGLVDAGVLDPDEKFDVNAQERAGTHLITKDLAGGKGLEDLKTGDMTLSEFETALGKQFEGIERGLDDVIKEADEGTTSDIQLESGPETETNIFDPIDPQDKGREDEYQFNLNLGGSDKDDESGGSDTDDESNVQTASNQTASNQDKNEDEITVSTLPKPAEKVEQITSYTNKDGKTIVDDPDTPQNEAVIAQLGLGSSLASGRDIGVPNAAESAFLMEALNEMEFDDKGNLVGAEPNFFEETLNKVIKNLTLGAFDPNDPQRREDALAILDNYEKTGKFVYDTEELSVSEIAKRLKEQGEKGLEPAVVGVEGADGSTVGFDDGTGFRNIMGDYDPVLGEDGQVFSGGSDTQNILTGSTNVFGDADAATNITTGGGGDDDDDDDTTTDDVDLGHTVDDDGNIVCNTEGYVYNPETKICEKKKVEDKDPTINVVRGEDFDDVLSRVTTAAPGVGSISGNVQTMQEGGMAGLNRAADNFLQALAG